MNLENIKISVIGLGYVGLPLAVAFAKKFNVVGYDIDESRIKDLKCGIDKTREVGSATLKSLNSSDLSSTFSISNPIFVKVSVIVVKSAEVSK